jgi:hypothetical protein
MKRRDSDVVLQVRHLPAFTMLELYRRHQVGGRAERSRGCAAVAGSTVDKNGAEKP